MRTPDEILQLARDHRLAGRLDAAYAAARAVLAQTHDRIEALELLGQIDHTRGAHEAARNWFDRALGLAPDNAGLHAERAAVRLALGDARGAAEDAEVAVRTQPSSFRAWLTLGLARERLVEHGAAVEALERACALQPEDGIASQALSRCLYLRGDAHHRSRALLRETLARDPRDATTRLLLANSLLEDAQTDAALTEFRTVLEQQPESHQARSNYLLALQYDLATTPADLLDAHLEWGRRHALTPEHEPRRFRPGACLRIGWHAPHFSDGPLASFVLPALEAMTLLECEHWLYTSHPAPDAIGERFRTVATEWRDLHDLSDEDVAQHIAADELDVLIDLAGHAPGNRLRALSLRPAPLQVLWGACTSGVPGLDVFLSDDFLTPLASERHFSERVERVARGRYCYFPPLATPDVGVRSDGPCVFVSSNRVGKLGDTVLRAWARILEACPGASLELRGVAFDDTQSHELFLTRARSAGVDPARLHLYGHATHGEVMQAYGRADIALDPFPFSGGASAADALWMGVPVVTWARDTVVSRQTGALLTQLGLVELIAIGEDDYVARAVALAHDPARRADLRRSLRERMIQRLDPTAFADELLATLRRLCEQAWRGKGGQSHFS